MEIFELSLDFVRSMFWPAIALTAIILFRSELTTMLGRVKHASWGDARVDLADAEKTVKALGADDVAASAGPGSGNVEESDSVRMTRSELQNLAETFARAGWATGAEGNAEQPPLPIIAWDESGAPSIARWEGVENLQAEERRRTNRLRAIKRRELQLKEVLQHMEKRSRPRSPNEAGNFDREVAIIKDRLRSTSKIRRELEDEASA